MEAWRKTKMKTMKNGESAVMPETATQRELHF